VGFQKVIKVVLFYCFYASPSWQNLPMYILIISFTHSMFLLHAFRLIATVAGCIQLKLSLCDDEYLANV